MDFTELELFIFRLDDLPDYKRLLCAFIRHLTDKDDAYAYAQVYKTLKEYFHTSKRCYATMHGPDQRRYDRLLPIWVSFVLSKGFVEAIHEIFRYGSHARATCCENPVAIRDLLIEADEMKKEILACSGKEYEEFVTHSPDELMITDIHMDDGSENLPGYVWIHYETIETILSGKEHDDKDDYKS